MYNKIAQQLRKPSGFLGKVISKFLKRMNSDIYIQMVKELKAQDGDKIYEIGYGHGSGVMQLSQNANCVIDGIDFSEVMYHDAVKLNQRLIQEDKVNLTFGDFLLAEINSDYYHKVFCVNVIYFWEDLVKPFAQVHDVLMEGGAFFIYMDSLEEIKNSRFTNDENFNLYNLEFVTAQLAQTGFSTSHQNFARGHIIKAVK